MTIPSQHILDKWAEKYEAIQKKPSSTWIQGLDKLDHIKLEQRLNKIACKADNDKNFAQTYCILENARKRGIQLQFSNIHKGDLEYNPAHPVLKMLTEYGALSKGGRARFFLSLVKNERLNEAEDYIEHIRDVHLSGYYLENCAYYGQLKSIEFLLKHNLLDTEMTVKLSAIATRQSHTIVSNLLINSLPDRLKPSSHKTEPEVSTGWHVVDDQTISFVQKLPENVTLQDIFNFRTGERTKVVKSSDPNAPAISQDSQKFDFSADEATIKDAYSALVKRGGTPKELAPEKQSVSVLSQPLKAKSQS